MVPEQVTCRTTNSVEGKIYDYFLVHSNLAAFIEPPDVLAAAGQPTHAPVALSIRAVPKQIWLRAPVEPKQLPKLPKQ
eukprot:5440098-Pyramimonas_sp.AAC.1